MERKILASMAVFATFVLLVGPVLAVKPADNRAGAQEVAWNLSADVMPVPPYGSRDIDGSDEACKLIMNEPNGAMEVVLTGVMRGLHPNTQYTVYLSKAYEPYVYTGWSIAGDWTIRGVYSGSNYDHDYTFTQNDGTFTGEGGYPAGADPYSVTETVSGTIDPMTGEITLHSEYLTGNPGYTFDAVAQIQADGSIVGTWGSAGQGDGHEWYSISGTAIETHTGDEWFPGLFTSSIQPFTFMTDEYGSASWHLNLRNSDFPGAGLHSMSVWINESGKTILISDVFEVVVE